MAATFLSLIFNSSPLKLVPLRNNKNYEIMVHNFPRWPTMLSQPKAKVTRTPLGVSATHLRSPMQSLLVVTGTPSGAAGIPILVTRIYHSMGKLMTRIITGMHQNRTRNKAVVFWWPGSPEKRWSSGDHVQFAAGSPEKRLSSGDHGQFAAGSPEKRWSSGDHA